MVFDKFRKLGNFLIFGMIMIFYFECVLMIVLLCFISNTLNIYSNRSHKYIKRLWLHLTMSALFIYFPKPLFIYYDLRVLDNTKNIIISNHLTEFDWLMILAVLYKLKRYDNVCILLKESLKNIPLLGYGMKYFGFIFLNRRIEKDREIIYSGVTKLKTRNCYDLLIFPEGTYLDSDSSKITQEYIKNNPVVLDNEVFIPREVLVPRITGFNLIRETLKKDLQGVIDITMLVTPYTKYPQDVYTYTRTLTDFNDRIGFSFYLDYIENVKGDDFVYKRFKEKDILIKKYKEEHKNIENMQSFINLTKSLKRERNNYKYDTIYIQSEWGPLFYTIFIFSIFLKVYIFHKILKKIICNIK